MSNVPGYQRFLAELKRRRVFRAAAGYGAGAFVVLQVADLVGEGLRLPPTFLTAITVLALAVFPFVLVLAWLFERAPGGDLRRTPDASRAWACFSGAYGQPEVPAEKRVRRNRSKPPRRRARRSRPIPTRLRPLRSSL
ncbi:MAG: hypothetical protein P8170_18265 [Gemmatimonadota bacterium]